MERPGVAAAAATVAPRSDVELSGSVKQLMDASDALCIPLELKILSALLVLFLFLLFLISVLWDRYGKEIGELYTSPTSSGGHGRDPNMDVKVHDVADEFTVYQKLPTFFYEYMPRRKKKD